MPVCTTSKIGTGMVRGTTMRVYTTRGIGNGMAGPRCGSAQRWGSGTGDGGGGRDDAGLHSDGDREWDGRTVMRVCTIRKIGNGMAGPYTGLHHEEDRDCDGGGDREGEPGSSPGKKIFPKHKTTLLAERTSKI